MSDDEQDNGFESDTDKRAHHNALERKRRDLIKDSFVMLRDVLPVFQGDKVRASRAQILTKGADYIVSLKRKNTVHQQDIEELKRHSKALDDQIRLLQKAKTPENIASAAVVVESAKTAIKNLDTFHGPENKDSTESEDSSDPDSYVTPRKRLR